MTNLSLLIGGLLFWTHCLVVTPGFDVENNLKAEKKYTVFMSLVMYKYLDFN